MAANNQPSLNRLPQTRREEAKGGGARAVLTFPLKLSRVKKKKEEERKLNLKSGIEKEVARVRSANTR